jgi:hypothetical protein
MQVLPKYERGFFMYSRFKKYASVLLDEMLEGVRLEYASKSRRYRNVKSRKIEIGQQIIESLPEDKRHLFFEYEECADTQSCHLEDYIYRKGIFHGIRLSGFFMKLFKH